MLVFVLNDPRMQQKFHNFNNYLICDTRFLTPGNPLTELTDSEVRRMQGYDSDNGKKTSKSDLQEPGDAGHARQRRHGSHLPSGSRPRPLSPEAVATGSMCAPLLWTELGTGG